MSAQNDGCYVFLAPPVLVLGRLFALAEQGCWPFDDQERDGGGSGGIHEGTTDKTNVGQ